MQLIISSILITRDERRQRGIHINHRESCRTKDVDIGINVSEMWHRIEFRNPSLALYQISRFINEEGVVRVVAYAILIKICSKEILVLSQAILKKQAIHV